MMIKVLMISVLVGTSAFAQVKKPKVKPVKEVPVQKHYLYESRSIALSENTRLTEALKAERSRIEGFEPCKVVRLQIEKTYNDWFLSRFLEIDRLEKQIDSSLAGANGKLETLKSQVIRVNAVKGQEVSSGGSEVEVSFRNLIEYFKIFNGRSKTCSKDQLPLLKKQMENPSLNDLNLSHSQIVTAMQTMTTNLNASLKDANASYEIGFSEASCGYSLELKSVIDIAGKKRSFGFSLLENSENIQFKISEEEKWNTLSKLNIGQTSLDGVLRYRKVINELKDSCTDLVMVPFMRSSTAYVKYSELDAWIKEGTKDDRNLGNDAEFVSIEGATYTRNDGSTATFSSFEIQTTEVTQAQWVRLMKFNPSTYYDSTYCRNKREIEGPVVMCPDLPVERASKNYITEFIKELNNQSDGYIYRIPTDVEWEYAARGGQPTQFFFGQNPGGFSSYAWTRENSHDGSTNSVHTYAVAQKLPNQFGLYDVYGNVGELVTNSNNQLKVYGGSFYYDTSQVSSVKGWVNNIGSYGLRLVRTKR